MRKYIVLLLITGIVWAQTDFDTLILKNGTTYFGEYSKIEEEIVYFKHQDAFAFQPISIKQVERLKLKDGQIIIGSIPLFIVGGKVNNSLTIEENQKLSTKVKVIFGCVVIMNLLILYTLNYGINVQRGGGGGDCGHPSCGGSMGF